MGVGSLIGAGLSLFGGFQEAEGIEETGEAALQRGREQRAYNEVAATQVEALGQIAAFEEGRQAEIMASRAVAVAAAGGMVSDVEHIIADIYGEGAYRASVRLHEAESAAERLRFEGKQAEQYGIDTLEAAEDQADATRFASLGSLFKVL